MLPESQSLAFVYRVSREREVRYLERLLAAPDL